MLDGASAGGRQAAEQLIPLVYEELRRLAAWRIRGEAVANTLQATGLVHEAYLRLSPGEKRWDGRGHFFAAAAQAMRRVLVERARRRKAVKHGGEMRRVEDFEGCAATPAGNDDQFLAVREVLARYAEIEPRKAEVVKLRYLIGMTIEETAKVLGISVPTAKRDWADARSWLFRELKREQDNL